MAIVTNGRLEYEMSTIDVTYPDIGKVTYRGSYPLIVSNQWTPPSKEYTDCITFTGESSDFTLKATYKEWDGTVEYSTDHNTWTVWDGSEISSSSQKLYLRGSGNTKFYKSNGARFVLSARAACSGNIQTLLEYSNPPTAVATYCYSCMFLDCTNLTAAPALPATTLAVYCYNSMFNGCTSLTTAPELPVTTLASSCYSGMFLGCTNLTAAPALPATTLADNCYGGMFNGCTSLTTAPALPATTLAVYCYNSMFNGCTSLTTAPELPVTTLAVYCYSSMFKGCTSLTTAPELPATTLADNCYSSMFRNCSKLKVNTTSGTKIFTCPSTIPTNAVYMMFSKTGGEFTDTPIAGNTYYWTE